MECMSRFFCHNYANMNDLPDHLLFIAFAVSLLFYSPLYSPPHSSLLPRSIHILHSSPLLISSVHLLRSSPPFISSVHLSRSSLPFISSIHLFCSSLLFISSVHLFRSSLPFIPSVHLFRSSLPFISSVHLLHFRCSRHWFTPLEQFLHSLSPIVICGVINSMSRIPFVLI